MMLGAIILVGAGAFLGGMQYQKHQIATQFSQNSNGRFTTFRRNGGGGGSSNGAPVSGIVSSVDPTGITVKLNDGSSKVVLLTDGTSITEATESSKQAIQSGNRVLVLGTTNSDGSVTAQSVQLNPQFRGTGGPTTGK